MIQNIEKKEYGTAFCRKRNKIYYRQIKTLQDAMSPAVNTMRRIEQKKAEENKVNKQIYNKF